MDKEYDVIVAGAGLAGCLAAASAAKRGAKVLLLDRNSMQEAGKKTNWGWVCGDAVAKTHVDFVSSRIGEKFTDKELETPVDGVIAISPDLKSKFAFEGSGYILNRPNMGRKLLSFAIKFGAKHLTEHEVEGPIVEDGKIVGVFGKDNKKEHFTVRGKVIVDALGVASTLRRKLPENDYVDRNISIEDVESTGRYIVTFEPQGENLLYYDPKNALIHLNQQMCPGGYGWVFPKGKNRINVGIGLEKKSLDVRNEKLSKKDNLHTLIDQYIEWNPLIKNAKVDEADKNGKGYWSVPVRRQLDSLVYLGYMGAGDSMAMPNPISAGGIGPALLSGVISGEIASDAAKANDSSIEFLWKYNLEFNKIYGNKMAALEVLRIYMQSLNNDQLNYAMSNFLTKEEAKMLSYGMVPELSLASKIKKALTAVSNINAFSNLAFVIKKMKTLNDLYSKYPSSPKDFKPWRESVAKEMKEVKQKFTVNPV